MLTKDYVRDLFTNFGLIVENVTPYHAFGSNISGSLATPCPLDANYLYIGYLSVIMQSYTGETRQFQFALSQFSLKDRVASSITYTLIDDVAVSINNQLLVIDSINQVNTTTGAGQITFIGWRVKVQKKGS